MNDVQDETVREYWDSYKHFILDPDDQGASMELLESLIDAGFLKRSVFRSGRYLTS